MAALASEVGISPAQLRRGFHEYLKTSPQSYVRGKRLNAARLMIETTDLPIHRIAQAHGFSSAALFTRTMKYAFGLSPLDLRRAVQHPPCVKRERKRQQFCALRLTNAVTLFL
jgi:transcriptional regulator GlxA family with amidase domain